MTSSRPRVNIGMPVYNGEAFVAAAIESLLAQTYTEFELIISDNASTDRTEAICRDFAARDPRVRYHRLDKNLGAVPNFNRVFELSDAEFFKWAAADDVCAPTFLERCVQLLQRDPFAVWVHTQSTHIDAHGRLLTEADAVDVTYTTRNCGSVQRRFRGVVFGGGGCLDSYGLIRSAVIRKTKLILPHFGAEKVFIAELALHGAYREVPETLFFPRVHDGGAGSLETAEEQQAYMNTGGGRSQWTRLKLLSGYLRAVLRSPLTLGERVRCLGVVTQYLLQVRKWKGIVEKTLRGTGIRGGNVERVRRLEDSEAASAN